MSDIWSNVGGQMPMTGDQWLYQKDGQVRGPVDKQQIVDKLKSGELPISTMVAREGGEFHPVSQIAAFAEDMDAVAAMAKKRNRGRTRKMVALVMLLLLAAGGAGGFYLKQEAEKKQKALSAEAEKEAAEREKKRQEALALLNKDTKLVALVSFDQSAMKVGGGSSSSSSKSKPSRRRGGGGSGGGAAAKEPSMVSQCQRDQNEIFGVLAKNLRKINVCVQDEKDRDKQGLLPNTLTLNFVVKPTGKTSDFGIGDRHYRTGPMRNCMYKVFQQIRYKSTGGSNCPVSIPIKIGG